MVHQLFTFISSKFKDSGSPLNVLWVCDDIVSESLQENLFVARVVYDLLFFFIVIIIVLNLIFGVIIDTFADLRSEKQQKDEILKNTCFVCGKKAETHVHVIVSMIDEKN